MRSASTRRAVFKPDKEKSGSRRPCSGRGRAKRCRIAALRFLLDLRPTGIRQAEQLRGLVEGFADGIVHRSAEQHIVADAAHRDDLRMAAGRKEQAIGEIDAVGEPRGERMRFEMS